MCYTIKYRYKYFLSFSLCYFLFLSFKKKDHLLIKLFLTQLTFDDPSLISNHVFFLVNISPVNAINIERQIAYDIAHIKSFCINIIQNTDAIKNNMLNIPLIILFFIFYVLFKLNQKKRIPGCLAEDSCLHSNAIACVVERLSESLKTTVVFTNSNLVEFVFPLLLFCNSSVYCNEQVNELNSLTFDFMFHRFPVENVQNVHDQIRFS